MGFATAWKALAKAKVGTKFVPLIRLRDHAGTLHTLTTLDNCIRMSKLVYKRERSFGVVQAQDWQCVLTDVAMAHMARDLTGCWIDIQAGPAGGSTWEKLAVGKIVKATADLRALVSLEVRDPLQDLVNAVLPRDMGFYEDGWISEIHTVDTAEGSATYDNATPLVITDSSYLADETFIIEFTSATQFKMIMEDGSESSTWSISSDTPVRPQANPAHNAASIPAAGWSTDSGAYTAGDRFIFYTSAERTTAELHPIGMVEHLITDVLGIQLMDVGTGVLGSPLYDSAVWTAAIAVTAGDTIAGDFLKGKRVMEMIQQLLQVAHASLWPAPGGGIGIWVSQPSSGDTVPLNSDPARGDITILPGSTYEETSLDCYETVTYNYLTLDGNEATISAVAEDAVNEGAEMPPIDIEWRVLGTVVESAANRAAARLGPKRKIPRIATPLYGASVEIGESVSITDAILGLSDFKADAYQIEIDLMNNSAMIVGWTDPLSIENYAIVGTSVIGGTDEVW